MVNIYENVDHNKRMSALVVALFVVFVVGTVYVFSRALGYGLDVVGIALIFSGISSYISYYYSDKIILGLSGAREASRKQDFHFYTVVENLALAARMPKPKLYVIDDTAMNAFATGRDPEHAVVCATTGLLQKLNRTELEGVFAHELSHIRNYDIRLMSIVTVLVGVIALLADWFFRAAYWGRRGRDSNRENSQLQALFFVVGLLLAMLSPIIAQLIQLAVSRRREFLADASGVALTKYPDGLVSALKKLQHDKEPLEAANKATAHLYIVNPLRNNKDARHWFAGLFNTHPPVEDRIQALQSM
ncbi:MAG TPA: M48 family metallopeptidase [Patescibacteria group bacterium]|nr:M48 family metallopeptidase [Patescibacteria group bacterium]